MSNLPTDLKLMRCHITNGQNKHRNKYMDSCSTLITNAWFKLFLKSKAHVVKVLPTEIAIKKFLSNIWSNSNVQSQLMALKWNLILLLLGLSTEAESAMTVFSEAYLCLLVDVPCEGDRVVGDLFDIADGIKAFFVVSCGQKEMLKWALRDPGKRGKVEVVEENMKWHEKVLRIYTMKKTRRKTATTGFVSY